LSRFIYKKCSVHYNPKYGVFAVSDMTQHSMSVNRTGLVALIGLSGLVAATVGAFFVGVNTALFTLVILAVSVLQLVVMAGTAASKGTLTYAIACIIAVAGLFAQLLYYASIDAIGTAQLTFALFLAMTLTGALWHTFRNKPAERQPAVRRWFLPVK
jgi:hypothetical protein